MYVCIYRERGRALKLLHSDSDDNLKKNMHATNYCTKTLYI